MLVNIIRSLAELPQVDRIALVINCSTRIFTSLALASLHRVSKVSTLIIDCESTDHSVDHFERIFASKQREVFICSMPLKPHGKTLDSIFKFMPVPEVLVLDSDIEILERDILESMDKALLADQTAYGSGLLQKGEWMTRPMHQYSSGVAWYQERMWLPLTLLRSAKVAERLEAGHSFFATRDHNEVFGWPRLSRLLSHRFRFWSSRNLGDTPRPKIIEWDTGSKIHDALRINGHRFSAIGDEYWASVHHAHGVTRSQLSSVFFRAAVSAGFISRSMLTDANLAEVAAMNRLVEHYPEYV